MWDNDKIELVNDMLLKDKSAAKIAKVLDTTRNAVMGKIFRDPKLKETMARRGSLRPRKPKEEPKHKPGKHPASQPKKPEGNTTSQPLPVSSDTIPTVGRPLIKIGYGMCNWPVNDAANGELHLMCGAPSDGKYCPHHKLLSIKPVQPRKATP